MGMRLDMGAAGKKTTISFLDCFFIQYLWIHTVVMLFFVHLSNTTQRKPLSIKGIVMTTLNSSFGLEYAPTSFLVRIGRREVLVTRDFRKRFYAVNPIIECDTGIEPGHVEVLLFRRWLLILSKGR
jgi:hypothetical protein